MWIIGIIAIVWVVAFLVFYFPGKLIGRWIAGKAPNLFVSLLFCIALAKLAVVIVAAVLLFSRFEFLPHVNADTRGFAFFFVGALFFVPAFSALLLGERKARRSAPSTA
jgi:hypothetical protein